MTYILGTNEAEDRRVCAEEMVHYCEPGNPRSPEKSKRAYHPQATEIDGSQKSGWLGGDTIRNRCPVCGHTWTEELPQ
jgi:hypothetical protein